MTDFERLLDAGHEAALQDAVALYRGDLLEGCDDEWLRSQRGRLRHRVLDALGELAELCEQAGDPGGAIGYAERLLRADPLREPAYRLLMR